MSEGFSDAPSWVPPAGQSPDLSQLIARVEAATEPSVDLFYAVASALLPDTFPSVIDHDHERVCWRVNVFGNFVSAGAWTDAALALVERVLPGWMPSVEKRAVLGPYEPSCAVLREGSDRIWEFWTGSVLSTSARYEDGDHRSPALALILALLRALQAQPNRHDARDGSSLNPSPQLSTGEQP